MSNSPVDYWLLFVLREIIKTETLIMNLSIGWTLNNKGGSSKNFTYNDLEKKLQELKNQSGTITLEILDDVDIGPQALQVRTEKGLYLITLGENTVDDYEIRSFFNPNKSNKKIVILGDYWPENQLTNDFEFVVKVFKEFYESGNVSLNLLS